MNRQREIIYGQRGKVLDGEDISDIIQKMIDDTVDTAVTRYIIDSDIRTTGTWTACAAISWAGSPTEADLRYTMDELAAMERADIAESLKAKAHGLYAGRVKSWGEPVAGSWSALCCCATWIPVDGPHRRHGRPQAGHLSALLRPEGPVVVYRLEGFEMFDAMIESSVRIPYTCC
jgi:preprotein translocase subunit SecA